MLEIDLFQARGQEENNAMQNIKYFLFIIILVWSLNARISALTLSIPDTSGYKGTSITIPIFVDTASGIAGANLILAFNPNIIEPLQVKTTDLSSDFSIVDSIGSNKIGISLARATGIKKGSGSLLTVKFKVNSDVNVGESTALVLEKVKLYDSNTSPIVANIINGSLTVISTDEILVLPNPFTPNGDGFNDYVEFILPPDYGQGITISLFSLAGKQVKKEKNINNNFKWFGRDEKGQDLKPDVYIYNISNQGETITNGTITLIR